MCQRVVHPATSNIDSVLVVKVGEVGFIFSVRESLLVFVADLPVLVLPRSLSDRGRYKFNPIFLVRSHIMLSALCKEYPSISTLYLRGTEGLLVHVLFQMHQHEKSNTEIQACCIS